MALICPKCRTRNRSVAKFCIECITSLPSGCAETDFAPAGMSSPKGLRIGVAGLVTLLIVGSAGWLVAGSGDRHRQGASHEDARLSRATEIQERAAPASPSTGNLPLQMPALVPPQDETDHPATATAAGVNRSRVPGPSEAPRPKAWTALTPNDPTAACSDMNFIAEAQCMASQCLKPAFKSHPQCEAVRRRQELEESKRNPTAP